ncbi:MAG: hypothetical protein NZ700_17915 [Gemmataceae bacterium]|nr:hypothetical protein [Gemmataceae bacterium]MDW8266445.1 hypothetical protein [Gemmataceae bacterium]
MEAAGPLLLFVGLVLAEALVALIVAPYAAHSFLVVVEETAAGNDAVVWPDEPFVDWVWKVFYAAWLAGIWLGPVYLVLRRIEPAPLGETPLWKWLVAAAVLWLLFPISLLSSLSAASTWAVLHGPLLGRMVQRWPAVLTFYGLSAAVVASGGLGVATALSAEWYALLPAAVGAAAAFLIYARLLGRLGWVLRRAGAAESRPRRQSPPLGVSRSATLPQDPAGNGHAEPTTDEEARFEVRQARRRRPTDPPPTYPFFSGVFHFPVYPTTLGAWAKLTVGFGLLSALVRLQVDLMPG